MPHAAVPAVRIRRASEYTGEHISQGHQQQNFSRKEDEKIDDQPHEDNPMEGMPIGKIYFLAAPESPPTHHEETEEADQQ